MGWISKATRILDVVKYLKCSFNHRGSYFLSMREKRRLVMNQNERFKQATFATWLGIAVNIFLTIIKGIAGIMSQYCRHNEP